MEMWDINASKNMPRLKLLQGLYVEGIAFGADGRHLFSCTGSGLIQIRDARTGEVLRHYNGFPGNVGSVVFSSNGAYALIGGQEGTINLEGWHRQELRASQGHLFSFPPGISISEKNHSLRLWDMKSGNLLLHFNAHDDMIRSVAISADAKLVLSGSSDMTLRLWDVETGKELRRFKGHAGRVYSVAFSPDGKSALSTSEDETIRLWQLPASAYNLTPIVK